jgi:hypothetical protein
MADLRIFGKTPKGMAEISTRAGGLSLAQRRLLILVDGTRDADQLAAMVPAGFAESLATLESGGFIAQIGARSADDDVAAPVPMAIPEAELTSVPEAKARAVRALNELLGPAADVLAIAIEKAAGGEELRPLIREAERLIGSTHGAAAAQAFIVAIRRR